METSAGGRLARVWRLAGMATAFVLRLYAIQLAAALLVFLALVGLAFWSLFQPEPLPPH